MNRDEEDKTIGFRWVIVLAFVGPGVLLLSNTWISYLTMLASSQVGFVSAVLYVVSVVMVLPTYILVAWLVKKVYGPHMAWRVLVPAVLVGWQLYHMHERFTDSPASGAVLDIALYGLGGLVAVGAVLWPFWKKRLGDLLDQRKDYP
jgi:hypothetical protein